MTGEMARTLAAGALCVVEVAMGLLERLMGRLVGLRATLTRRAGGRGCRHCGCTDDAACIDWDGGPCGWAEPDACSVCAAELGLF
jgi:hypothetical protein